MTVAPDFNGKRIRVDKFASHKAAASSGSATSETSRPWPDPLAKEAFHGLAGEIVREIEPRTEADTAAILIQTLVAFGNVIGRGPYYQVEGDRHATNLFAALVGDSSKARKGTSWGRVRQIFKQLDEEWTNERIQGGMSSGARFAIP